MKTISEVRAVYPGTFDPPTNGHLDLVHRAARLFHHVTVAILDNPAKQPLFAVDERVDMLEQATKKLPNVSVDVFGGLLVDYVRRVGATVVVRGIRAVSDFEYEFQMALMNRRLDDDIETVFMMPAEAYSYVSSRLIKEIASLGGSVKGLVPPLVEKRLKARYK
jgi:pantetheine-phosphate adenylyltransferase